MSIFIVRHGETNDNAMRRVQVPSSPLSERGKQQAKLLAARIAEYGVERIISSDFTRTQQTAFCVAELIEVAVETTPLLRERNFGELRGVLYSELEEDPFQPDYIPPEGESWSEFHDRVAQAWSMVAMLAAASNGNVLVVTHGLVCRSLVERQLMLPKDIESASLAGNTAFTEVDQNEPWAIRLLNCTAHISDSLTEGTPV